MGALGRASTLPTPSLWGCPSLLALPALQRLSVHNSRTGTHTSKVTPARRDSLFIWAWTRARWVNLRRPRPVTAEVPPRGRCPPPRATGQKAQQDPWGSEARREDTKRKSLRPRGAEGQLTPQEWSRQSLRPREPKGQLTPREWSRQSLSLRGVLGAAKTPRVVATVTEAEGAQGQPTPGEWSGQ